MNASVIGRPPAWFRVAAVLGLVWTLFGVFMYLVQVGIFGDVMPMTPEEQSLADLTPVWVTAAFAIAVFAGALGALGLVLLKSWARLLLILSLVAVLVQEVWVLFLSGAADVHGASAIVLPILVIAIAALLVWMAHLGVKRGWLR